MRGLLGLAILAIGSFVSFSAPPTGGNYPPVQGDDLPRLKLHHYHPPEAKARDADFEWRFTKDGFEVKKGTGPIPAHLIEKLLPEGTPATHITGKWAIVGKMSGSQKIVFTEIRANGKAGRDEASYNIYKTAPTVVRIGEPQYVFSVEIKK